MAENPITEAHRAETDKSVPVALTIAGSDSGGGAGIQADLKTFAFHCVHGTSALTCVTAQNTLGVMRVDALSPEAVVAQIKAVVEDIGVQAVKTGMLLNSEIIEVVTAQVQSLNLYPLIVDPVMVSRAGVQLINDEAVAVLQKLLMPQATLVTPNRYEAQILAKQEIQTLEDMYEAAKKIHDLGPKAVLVKGGGMAGTLRGVDVWFDGCQLRTLKFQTIDTLNTHGTGCTLSAAITANLALGKDLLPAVEGAKKYVTQALQFSLELGQGQGPVGHFFSLVNSLTQNSLTPN
ncbi:MAG: bifunctional hydroxymethylpyrimidine kinase/phosphomethylpyrimidine kinase [Microcoleaceae cyanobacterium]